jgi:hypothetical protein
MRIIIFFGLCAIGLSFSSCKKDDKADNPIAHGYFQYSFVYSAWSNINAGWIIDKSGNVKSYENPQKWNEPDSLGYISEQQLIENLSHCDSLINTIASSDLTYYNTLVESASKGQMTPRKRGGADMGAQRFYCYWYDKSKGKYKQIILSQYGDVIFSNTDSSAIKIDSWLMTIKY